MPRIYHILLIVLFLAPAGARGQDKKAGMPGVLDSAMVDRTVQPLPSANPEGTERFYDSLKTKSDRSGFGRLLYDTFFRRPKRDTTSFGQFVDETYMYERYRGKTIATVDVDRFPIFDEDDNWFERTVNKSHTRIRKNVVRRDLYFRPGDKVDPDAVVGSKYLLLSRDYLSDIDISFNVREDDTTMVDVVVRTVDRLTLALDGAWRGSGKTMVEVYDESVLGSGNMFSVRTHFNRNNWTYMGNSFEYEIPNIAGSFYKAEVRVGREFYDDLLRASIWKDFILPDDYDLGVSFSNDRLEYYSLYNDQTDSIRQRKFEVWSGKSIYIRPIKASIYLTALYGNRYFGRRPYVDRKTSPYFHNADYMYYGLGLFREKFYRANMIYGYGRKEYIPEGFRFEIMGGYAWKEFDDEYYTGLRFHRGKMHSWGYLRAAFEIGTSIGAKSGSFRRSTMNIDIQWISQLFVFRRTNLRQFVSFNHMRGWNRYAGEKETLTFTDEFGLRSFDSWVTGRNRTVLNTETVFFTPYEPWGFRMAFFTFADFGLLGDHGNMLKNAFYSTIGLGVRFKNERFVFSTIQLKLGMAIGKRGLIGNDWVSVSTEPRLERHRFVPGYPTPVKYE